MARSRVLFILYFIYVVSCEVTTPTKHVRKNDNEKLSSQKKPTLDKNGSTLLNSLHQPQKHTTQTTSSFLEEYPNKSLNIEITTKKLESLKEIPKVHSHVDHEAILQSRRLEHAKHLEERAKHLEELRRKHKEHHDKLRSEHLRVSRMKNTNENHHLRVKEHLLELMKDRKNKHALKNALDSTKSSDAASNDVKGQTEKNDITSTITPQKLKTKPLLLSLTSLS